MGCDIIWNAISKNEIVLLFKWYILLASLKHPGWQLNVDETWWNHENETLTQKIMQTEIHQL